MIGQIDLKSERSDTTDATETVAHATEKGLGMLGFWSVHRDHLRAEAVERAMSTVRVHRCAGLAFAGIFARYA